MSRLPSSLRARGPRRVGLTVGAFALVAALGAAPALAFWSTSGTATADATARTLATPATPSVGSATQTSLVVSGTLPTSGTQVPGTAYTVKRGSTTLGCALPSSGSYSCTDTGLTGGQTYSYTVVAALGAWTATSPAKTGTTTCAAAPKFTVAASDTTPTAGTAFTVTITAKNCSNATDTTFSGSQPVTFTGPSDSPSGKSPAYPANVTFTNGVGTATVTLYDVETTTLTASSGSLSGATGNLVVGVTNAEPWTIILTNATNKNGAVTVDCTDGDTLNETTHTCSQTSSGSTGNSRTWGGRFTLVDKWGNPQPNPGGAMNLTVTASNGQSRNLSIAQNSATTATFTFTLSNGSSAISLTGVTTNTIPTVTTTVTGAS